MIASMRVALVCLLVACNRPHTMPASMTGTYASGAARAQPALPKELDVQGLPDLDLGAALGGADELTISPNGISLKSNNPLRPPEVKVGPLSTGPTTSDLFTRVECPTPASCTFRTKSGCEGSLDKDGKGGLQIVATGACSQWAGTWTPVSR